MGVRDRLQGIFRDVFDDNSIVLFDAMTADDDRSVPCTFPSLLDR